MQIQSQINSIHQLVELQVSQTPDAVAVVFEDKQLTYRELNERANQLAHYLQTLGVKPEVLVGICVDRSLEMIVGLLGILKAGGAYLPLDMSYPLDRLSYMLEDAQAPILLTQSHLSSCLPRCNSHVICLDNDWQAIATHSTADLQSQVNPENLAYAIYTSGSTGKPKGVAMPLRPLINLLAWQQSAVTKRLKTLQYTPISFDVSFQEIFSTLAEGGTLVLISEETRRDPVDLLHVLSKAAIERLFLPFVALRQLATVAQTEEVTLSCLKEIITAGEQLRITPAIANWFNQMQNCTLHNHYGPSESHVVTAFTLTGSPNEWSVLPPIGRPVTNTQIYLLDDQLRPVPDGSIGELYIGGLCLARGYLNRPELTAERFIANPFSTETSQKLYKTGDLAKYLPDGNIEFLGRADQQVKIRGFRIEPGEIEAIIEQHPMVQEAVVIAHEDVLGDKRIIAYLVSNIFPERISYEFDCVAEFGNNKITLRTKDISASGICLVGVPSNLTEGMSIHLHLRLPTDFEDFSLKGLVAWREGEEAGIQFLLAPSELVLLQQSLEYLLETQGLLKIVQRTLMGSLRSYLKQKLPDYMIPRNFIMMKSFPLTPSGKVNRQSLPALNKSRPELEVKFVSARSILEAKITHMWQEILILEKVGIHDNFFDLGGYSLQAVELVTKIQKAFQVKISLYSFMKTPTIAGLAQILEAQQIGTSSLLPSFTLELADEAVLDLKIQPRTAIMQSADKLENIFLTGATGFLGAFLLHELLERTQANIYCLVRAANIQQASKRLRNNLEKYSLWNPNKGSRIIPIVGDLSLPLLGFTPEHFQILAETIDIIFHNGGLVNFVYPYSLLKASNVLGTQEILRLASQTKIKPVHFISSIDVFSPTTYTDRQIIQEQKADFTGDLFGYAQSKLVAEKLIAIAAERGLPTTIFRPAWIEGHSQTGVSNHSDFLRSLIKGCIQLGLSPDWNMQVDIVPVDYVSQAIIYLSSQKNSLGKIFHLTNPQSISWHELVNWMRTYGYSLQQVPHEQWILEVLQQVQSDSEHVLYPFITFLSEPISIQQKSAPNIYFQPKSPSFDCQNTLNGLDDTNLSCPPVNDRLLSTYFAYLINTGFLECPPLYSGYQYSNTCSA